MGERVECGGKEGNIGESWERGERWGNVANVGNVGGTLGERWEEEKHTFREDDLPAKYFLSSTSSYVSILHSVAKRK